MQLLGFRELIFTSPLIANKFGTVGEASVSLSQVDVVQYRRVTGVYLNETVNFLCK